MYQKYVGLLVGSIVTLQALPAASDSIQSNLSVFDAEDCAPVIEDKLSSLSIADSNVKKISYITRYYNPSDHAEKYEYEGWISFASCTGNLVINMDEACFIRQVYARGDCTKKGTPLP